VTDRPAAAPVSDVERNPYAPPRTGVRDVASGAAVQKPAQVGYAVALMWISLLLDVIDTLLDPAFPQAVPVAQTIIVAMLALQAVFIVLVSAGHNWARIVALLMFGVAILLTVPDFGQEYARSRLVAVLDLVSMAVEAVAMVLIFTRPGSAWFRRRA